MKIIIEIKTEDVAPGLQQTGVTFKSEGMADATEPEAFMAFVIKQCIQHGISAATEAMGGRSAEMPVDPNVN